MAGKSIGEFSLKAITGTYSPGPAGGILNQVILTRCISPDETGGLTGRDGNRWSQRI